jgi:hypothetical protein
VQYDSDILLALLSTSFHGNSNIISSHQEFLKSLIRLSNARTIVHIKRSQGVNLVMQMARQWLGESLDQTPDLGAVKVLWRTRLGVLVEDVESGGECAVLLDVVLHEAFDAREFLDAGEELCLFGIVVVVHGLAPALAVEQEVTDCGLVFDGDVGRLQEDGVESADHAIMGKGHLGCHIVCRVRGLRSG